MIVRKHYSSKTCDRNRIPISWNINATIITIIQENNNTDFAMQNTSIASQFLSNRTCINDKASVNVHNKGIMNISKLCSKF